MKKVVMTLSVVLMIVSGCGNNEGSSKKSQAYGEYSDYMKKIETYTQNDDFTQAVLTTELAMDMSHSKKPDGASDTLNNLEEQLKALERVSDLMQENEAEKANKLLTDSRVSQSEHDFIKNKAKDLDERSKKLAIESKKEEDNKLGEHEVAIGALWNDNKTRELKDFMNKWEQTMGQTYDDYYPGKDTNYYGLRFPGSLSDTNFYVNERQSSVKWSENGKGTDDYNIVAIYSDDQTARYLDMHLYFFAITKEGQAVVLVTMQNQGNQENVLYFKPTENAALSAGFSDIVKR